MKKITRRELLKNSALAAIGGALYTNMPVALYGNSKNKSKVVLIRNKEVLSENRSINQEIIAEMLDEAVKILTSEVSTKDAWKKIITPKDIVGVKSNE